MNLSKDIHDMKGTLRDIIEADPMDIPRAHFRVQIAQVMACMLQNQLEAMRLIARYGGDAPRALAFLIGWEKAEEWAADPARMDTEGKGMREHIRELDLLIAKVMEKLGDAPVVFEEPDMAGRPEDCRAGVKDVLPKRLSLLKGGKDPQYK
jgi:hypothetical protein